MSSNRKSKSVKKNKIFFIIIFLIIAILALFLLTNTTKGGSAVAILNTDNQMIISLKEGWNYFSTNIIPNDTTMSIFFTDLLPYIEDLKVVVPGSNPIEYMSVYNNQTQTWLVDDFDYKLGYKIKINNDVNFSILGIRADGTNSNNEILLYPGYNMISYLPNEEKSIDEIFGSYSSQISYVKDQISSSMPYGNDFFGSLNVLHPGNAYIVEVNSTDPFYLTYEVAPVEPNYISLTNLFLDIDNHEQTINESFVIYLSANQDISELVDVSININSNNCMLVSNGNYLNHYELNSQNLSTELDLEFSCNTLDNSEFNFTVTGQESGVSLNDSLVVNIIEEEIVLQPLEEINLINNNQNIFVNDNFDITVSSNNNITEFVDILVDINSSNCMLNDIGEYANNFEITSQDISNGLDLEFSCNTLDNYEFNFTVTGHESNNILTDSLVINVQEILLITGSLNELSVDYIVSNDTGGNNLNIDIFFNDDIEENVDLVFDIDRNVCRLESSNNLTNHFEFNNINFNEFNVNLVCAPIDLDLYISALGNESNSELSLLEPVSLNVNIEYLEISSCEDLQNITNNDNPNIVYNLAEDLYCENISTINLQNDFFAHNHFINIDSSVLNVPLFEINDSNIVIKDLIINNNISNRIKLFAIYNSDVNFENLEINYSNILLENSTMYNSVFDVGSYSNVDFTNLNLNITGELNNSILSVFNVSQSNLNINMLGINSDLVVDDLFMTLISFVIFNNIVASNINVNNGYSILNSNLPLYESGVYFFTGTVLFSTINLNNVYTLHTYCYPAFQSNNIDQVNITNSFTSTLDGLYGMYSEKCMNAEITDLETLYLYDTFEDTNWDIINSLDPEDNSVWHIIDELTLPQLNENFVPFNAGIIYPLRNTSFLEGDAINFHGYSNYNDNGVTYSWYSSINGQFSTSKDAIISNLDYGIHEITFTVFNNVLNETKSDSIIINVGDINDPENFVSVWNTENDGVSEYNQVRLPLTEDGTYSFFIDWGDYIIDYITNYNQDEIIHTYNNPGIYTINIYGDLNGIGFGYNSDFGKILEISNWGNMNLGNNGYYFKDCNNLTISATDTLNLEGITNLEGLFYGCESIINVPYMNDWDVSNVTDMSYMFYGAHNFNQSIVDWDVSNVIDMSHMFHEAFNFNQSIVDWDVSNVIDMSHMFHEAFNFNQNIIYWHTWDATDMSHMFHDATSFEYSPGWWNVGHVTNMSHMFHGATSFAQGHAFSNWDVSNVTDMSYMFSNLDCTYSIRISNWDVSNVTNMSHMFDGLYTHNPLMISNWDVSSVTDMAFMFHNLESFNQDLSSWNVSSVYTHLFFDEGAISWILPRPNFPN